MPPRFYGTGQRAGGPPRTRLWQVPAGRVQ